MDTPVDTLPIAELPTRWGPLAFLFPDDHKPTFNNDRVAVTREAADALATCFKRLVRPDRSPPVPRPMAQRFTLQMLVALFAEDIGLLEKYFVTNLLNECHSPTDTYDLIGGLFAAMNSREAAHGGRFKDIPYFNGGLFADPARLELHDQELVLLRKAADYNWTKVQPEIFGTLFQHSMEDVERHAFGAHFTHPADIMKIVGPTIVQPWREQIDAAKTLKRLIELRDRLHSFLASYSKSELGTVTCQPAEIAKGTERGQCRTHPFRMLHHQNLALCGSGPDLAGQRKQRLRRKAEEVGLISDRNNWVWKPKRERP
jgi:hypothetical protein